MKSLFGYLVLFVIMHFAYYVRGECCRSTEIVFERNNTEKRCEDFNGKPLSRTNACVVKKACGNGKPLAKGRHYCGKGDCNIFGCECNHGCIPGDARDNFKKIHSDSVTIIYK